MYIYIYIYSFLYNTNLHVCMCLCTDGYYKNACIYAHMHAYIPMHVNIHRGNNETRPIHSLVDASVTSTSTRSLTKLSTKKTKQCGAEAEQIIILGRNKASVINEPRTAEAKCIRFMSGLWHAKLSLQPSTSKDQTWLPGERRRHQATGAPPAPSQNGCNDRPDSSMQWNAKERPHRPIRRSAISSRPCRSLQSNP